ncbi:MAG: mannose-1-phosphate guanylyltransferase [Sphingobacteriales bacterium]|jgi:mannose-1-phosphate guanylyltransferase
MAGGIGSRFWPASRSTMPKQFLDILGMGKTLIQITYDRFLKICPPENIFIVTNESYRPLVKQQLEGIDDMQILGEPVGRNTAPCVAYACFKIATKSPDANIVVAPSDHLIMEEEKFIKGINESLEFASTNDNLITLGIKPTRPDTGYGYIQYLVDEKKPPMDMFKVKIFTEKPDLQLAKTFIKSGDFLWNAGIFVWNVQSILKAFKAHLPDMSDLFSEGNSSYYTENEAQFIKKTYSQCTNISIDYGIMEKAENVMVKPAQFGWSDLGTWGSLFAIKEKDYMDNAVNGDEAIMYESSGCMVNVPKDKLVVLQGLKDFIVVDTGDALLVCKKSEEQKIKQMVADVKKRKNGAKYI